MKTNLFQLSLLFLLCVSVLCGCADNDEPVPATDGTVLTVHATADGFASADGADTRASESGYTTTFTEGDQIGVFAVGKDGYVIEDCKNVPLTYDGTGWEGTVYYYTGAKYFAYYPYDVSMNDKTNVDDIVKAFKPQPDQGAYANYTKSDLMTADNVSPSNKTLSFSFAHKMSLIEISLPVQKYTTGGDSPYEYSSPVIGATFNITSNENQQQTITPYNMGGGVYRYIVSADNSHTVGGEFQTGDGKTIEYSKAKLSLSAGSYKRLNVSYDGAPSETIERSLDIGDFYYSDGGICPKNVLNPPSEGCIGIVFSTDVSRIGQAAKDALKEKGVETPHGLVMALTYASNGCRWGEYGKDENKNGADGEPFKENTETLKQQYNNVDGYAETHWIIDTYKNDGNKLEDTYTAFYHASRYGTADGSTAKYAAPGNTTGWFIPSMGQWWDILSNLGKVNLDSYKENEDTYTYISGAATTAVDNMNIYLNKVNDAETFNTSTYFWSSSEYDSNDACYVGFYSNGYLYLSYDCKDYTRGRVRCVLAF